MRKCSILGATPCAFLPILTGLHQRPRRTSLSFRFALALVFLLGLFHPASSRATTITYAGFAYAGDAGNIESRFKYSRRYEARTDVNSKLRQAIQGGRYPFDLNVAGNTEIKGDATLVTTLTVTGEIISHENVRLGAQAAGPDSRAGHDLRLPE